MPSLRPGDRRQRISGAVPRRASGGTQIDGEPSAAVR
jgi:hypothetical protein